MRYLCKDCWIAHTPATLLARCHVCDANANIRRLDPLQSLAATTETAPGERPELVCRRHPAEALEIFCGECRHPLSPRSLLNERSVMAVLGATGSGKTCLLWALRQHLAGANGLPLQIRQSLGDSDEQLETAVQALFIAGQARTTQRQDAVTRNYAWELMTTVQPRRSALVAFHDAAGEVWNDLDRLPRDGFEKLLRYLDLIGGVIFLIDGEQLAETLTEPRGRSTRSHAARIESQEIAIVDALARRLGPRKRETPVAVVVSKADVLWDDSRWAVFRPGQAGRESRDVSAAVKALLAAANRGAIAAAFEESFGAVGYFAVSAFGRSIATGDPLSAGNIEPARIEDPLLALIGEEVADGIA